ncbi:MAG: hypothetical protein NTU60_02645 [Candidatus Aminicenantes bacterium]|nr:hypothetical protein [Candidatus Aminicenantes bacterium]
MRKTVFIKFVLGFMIGLALGLPAAAQIPVLPSPQTLPVDAAFDEIAKFISGIPCDSQDLKTLQETPEWKNFAAGLEKSWGELELKRLGAMRTWAQSELAGANAATKTLFYPFGGPDFLTAFDLFPEADSYILMGLEFIGKLPEFTPGAPNEAKHVEAYLGNLTAALADFFNKSYFITKNMNTTLARDKVDGVLPVICFFLKRTNNSISSVKRIEVMENGQLLEYDFALPRQRYVRPYGIKIEFFTNGTNRLRSLTYFSCDLFDVPFAKDKPFYIYTDSLNFETTFVKSASYLLHYGTFNNIRNIILRKSRFILEDDTGIPLRYFKPAEWDAQLYGEYIKPVSDFKGVDQLDLEEAYKDPVRVKKLPFHLGYHWGTNKDSILYFKRK